MSQIGSTCWPLLQAVFSCSELRRCQFNIDFRLHIPGGRPDFAAVWAALRPEAEPAPLPPLLNLHTLHLALPLSAGELQCVLHACPALLQLTVQQNHALDALQCTRLTAQHASPTLRCLNVCSMIQLTTESCSATDQPDLTTTPLPLPPFPALRAFSVSGHIHPSWPEPALLRMVQLLRHAPLLDLNMMHAPMDLLHHLAPLTELRSLRTPWTTLDGLRNMGSEQADNYIHYFLPTTRFTIGGSDIRALHGGQGELRRRVLGALIDDEADEVSDEQLAAKAQVGRGADCRHLFVRERLFDGMDGREAFMAALQRRNAQMTVSSS